jgi:hypothetical protein
MVAALAAIASTSTTAEILGIGERDTMRGSFELEIANESSSPASVILFW